jgi:hypothetical protein
MPTLERRACVAMRERVAPAAPLAGCRRAGRVRTHEDYNILATLRPGRDRARRTGRKWNTITARLRHDQPEVEPAERAA